LKNNYVLGLIARPWVDPVCLWGLKRIFPASRAWAAAGISQGDPDRFADELDCGRVPGMAKRLKKTVELKRKSDAAFTRWNDTVFGGNGDAAVAEDQRRSAAQNWTSHRFTYLMFARRHGLPAVQLDVPTPAEVMDEFAGSMADPDAYFSLPDRLPEVERSREIENGDIIEYWLRFPTPGVDHDTVYAHVYEPKRKPASGRNGAGLPTLIFGHGLAIETEMMKGDLRGYGSLAERGMRVILPDAPGHNRRVADGLYGGESFIIAPPSSGLRHLAQAAKEFGVIAAWARGNGSKHVAFSGMSLGALTSQVAAGRTATWPSDAKPDALMLLTTTDKVSSLALDSALAVVAGLNVASEAAGWTPASFVPLAKIVDAEATPPLDPERIVLLIGERDTVTPIDGGRRLATKWQVPAKNLFRRDQGHFSAAFGLGADPSPFRRISEILVG
jgi:pimeloyl-ACP methyl ester carboxylesterase